MKKIVFATLIFFLSFFLFSANAIPKNHQENKSDNEQFSFPMKETVFLSSDENPFYSILSTPLACSYTNKSQQLNPLLLVHNNTLTPHQLNFISNYSIKNNTISIGFTPTNNNPTVRLNGKPPSIAHQIAKMFFPTSSQALILPYNQTTTAYKQSMIATPLASYLHMPILLYDTENENIQEIKNTLKEMNVKKIYIVAPITPEHFSEKFEKIQLQNTTQIQNQLLSVIKKQFQTLNYITITNPADVIPLNVKNEQYNIKKIPSIHHTALFLGGKKYLINGVDTISTHIIIPSGIHKLSFKISMKNTTSIFSTHKNIPTNLHVTLRDPTGKIVAYAHSPGYKKNEVYIETLITNLTGKYNLTINLFHGYKGGYFSVRGISNVQTTLVIKRQLQTLQNIHYPLIRNLSQNAAYLTSAHGGIIVADEHSSIFDEKYESNIYHHATGPWYEKNLHQYNNEKVNHSIKKLEQNLSLLKKHHLYSGYVNGSGWLAILADTNMIPMYYYSNNQTHLVEQGLPSDNPYSLNHQLSPGRIISYTAEDTSLLIARTLFYEQLCGPANKNDQWHRTFHFIFGEGFGETGGIFHQIPYANTIQDYGFITEIFGDFRNSRQAAERLNVYTEANYVEYLGHGDWFWFTPSIYGFNSVGQAIGAADIRHWSINRPNIFLSSACLMGRVDGVPSEMSVALSFLHAGSNAFIGATRETGREAGLTVLENHLILDDYSLGEALRGEKRVDKIGPTYYVRCLFGDPAFNPYDPLHGFSNQGLPLN